MAKNIPATTEPEVARGSQVGESGGFRGRFARLAGPRNAYPELDPVIKTLRRYHPKADTRTLERAYEMAEYLHRDQKRRSGEPYITHPVAVASLLADLGMPASTLSAALLHDTVEIAGTHSMPPRTETKSPCWWTA